MLWNNDELGVGTIRRNPITNLKAGNACSHGNHYADIAVPERYGLVQLAVYRIDSSEQTVGSRLFQNLHDFVRLMTRFLDPVGLTEFDQHALGASRNQRANTADQQIALRDHWGRQLE